MKIEEKQKRENGRNFLGKKFIFPELILTFYWPEVSFFQKARDLEGKMKKEKGKTSFRKTFQHLEIVFEPPLNQNMMSPSCFCSCCGIFSGRQDLETARDAAVYARKILSK
jgi:hypothetical protein